MNKSLKTTINPVRNQRFLNWANGVKILILLITIFGAGLIFASSAKAIDVESLVVQFEKTTLFDEGDFKPGDSIARWAKVFNNSAQSQRIATEAINYPGFPDSEIVPSNDLSRALSIIIREKGGEDLYGGSVGEKTLFDFYQDGETYLSDIAAGEFQEYEFEVSFPIEKSDEWQGKTTGFDILVGFQGAGGGVPPGTGGGGGGVVWPLGLVIKNEGTSHISTISAKITWHTSFDATSKVVYGTAPGVFNLNTAAGGGPPKYGYHDSTTEADTPADSFGVTFHEVELTGLIPNTIYYYRCISHASPPTIGLEHSFTTLAAITEVNEGQIGEEVEKGIREVKEEKGKDGREEIGGEEIILPIAEATEGESVGEDNSWQEEDLIKDKSGLEEEIVQKAFFSNLLAGLGLFLDGITWFQWMIIILILCLIILLFRLKKKREEKKKKNKQNM